MGRDRGSGRSLEAGWGQRIAWSVLVVATLGLLVWVPFLYVAIRRGRGSDWLAFAAFLLYELVTLPWASIRADGPGDPILGAVAVVGVLMAVAMLLFAMFDRPSAKYAAVDASPPQGNPYNPYMR